MDCDQSETNLNGYLDGELGLTESLAFEQHLQTCAICRQRHAAYMSVRAMLNDGSFHFRAPTALRNRAFAALPTDDRIEVKLPAFKPRWWIGAVGIAATFVLVAFIWLQSRPSADDLVAQEIVSGHIRSMMANHLTDVPSLDRHTVKPWFDGKLDFAPPVADLSSKGFPLIGGRLDYIQSRPVAALVYKRQQHFINLFIWTSSSPSDETKRVLTRQGYNLIRWNESGMTFWAVSDLELTELQQFAADIQNPN